MPYTVCLHCSLRALVDGVADPPIFEETPDQHQQRVHPDLDAAQRERRELEAALLQLDAISALARRAPRWQTLTAARLAHQEGATHECSEWPDLAGTTCVVCDLRLVRRWVRCPVCGRGVFGRDRRYSCTGPGGHRHEPTAMLDVPLPDAPPV